MRSIGWLHFSDFHQGLPDQQILWPSVSDAFRDDLVRIHKKSGPWDVVFFTGDLTQQGSAAEFAALDETLADTFKFIAGLQGGCEPLLLTIPGNHDLVRPKGLDPADAYALQGWTQLEDLRSAFWAKDVKHRYRELIDGAFSSYLAWTRDWRRRHPAPPSLKLDSLQEGILPGDFSAVIVKDGLELGVVGLNSAFLQLRGDLDYQGRLDVDPRQIQAVCTPTPSAWCKARHIALLMSHHPPDWLHGFAGEQGTWRSEIDPPGRFLAHLFGHRHEARFCGTQDGGAALQRAWQGPSLFGLHKLADGSTNRVHGYSAGRFEADDAHLVCRVFPRVALLGDAGSWTVGANIRSHLDAESAMVWPSELRRPAPPDPPAPPSSPVSLPARQLPPGNFPRLPAEHVARTDLVAEVRREVEENVVTLLYGGPGMGKSSLALSVAAGLPGAHVRVDCANESSFEKCIRTLADVLLGDRFGQLSVKHCEERVSAFLARHEAVILLDRIDGMLDDEGCLTDEDMRDWLDSLQPPTRVLVTSGILAIAHPWHQRPVPPLTPAEARELFRKRSGKKGAGDGPPIDQICAQLMHHPLAISVVAPMAKVSPLKQVLNDVKQWKLGANARSQLDACFGHSYKRLRTPAQMLLQTVSLLPDSVGLDLMTALTDQVGGMGTAQELVLASLLDLRGEDEHVRYVLSAPIQQFVRGKLGEEQRREAWTHVAETVIGVAKSKAPRTQPGKAPAQTREALDWFADELHNLAACAHFDAESGDGVLAGELADSMLQFAIRRGRLDDYRYICELALRARDKRQDKHGEAVTRNCLAVVLQFQGHGKAAIGQFKESLRTLHEIEESNTVLAAKVSNSIAWNYLLRGRQYEDAERALRSALRICEEGEKTHDQDVAREFLIERSQTLSNLGVLHTCQEQWEQALRALGKSLALKRDVDALRMGQTLNRRGQLHLKRKDFWAAGEDFKQSLDYLKIHHEPFEEATSVRGLGEVMAGGKDWKGAEERLREAHAIFKELSFVEEARTLLLLARVLRDKGDREEARGTVRTAMDRLGVGVDEELQEQLEALEVELSRG